MTTEDLIADKLREQIAGWIRGALDYHGVRGQFLGEACQDAATSIQEGLPALTARLDREAEEPKLPYDIRIGNIGFGAGVRLSTFVDAARRWYEAASALQPAPGGTEEGKPDPYIKGWMRDQAEAGRQPPRNTEYPTSPSLVHPEEVAATLNLTISEAEWDALEEADAAPPAPSLDADFEAVRTAMAKVSWWDFQDDRVAANDALDSIHSRLGEVVGALAVAGELWSDDLEAARLDLCEFLLDCAADNHCLLVHVDLQNRLREAEQAFTLLGEIANCARKALESRDV